MQRRAAEGRDCVPGCKQNNKGLAKASPQFDELQHKTDINA